nr:MAG TPA: hypothetical protein [Caudoviricetes sp.]
MVGCHPRTSRAVVSSRILPLLLILADARRWLLVASGVVVESPQDSLFARFMVVAQLPVLRRVSGLLLTRSSNLCGGLPAMLAA